jgi:hypothetical protein
MENFMATAIVQQAQNSLPAHSREQTERVKLMVWCLENYSKFKNVVSSYHDTFP